MEASADDDETWIKLWTEHKGNANPFSLMAATHLGANATADSKRTLAKKLRGLFNGTTGRLNPDATCRTRLPWTEGFVNPPIYAHLLPSQKRT